MAIHFFGGIGFSALTLTGGTLSPSGYLHLCAAIAAFILFCKEKKSLICVILILTALFMDIAEEIHYIVIVTNHVSLFFILINIRNICICFMFLYQTGISVIYREFIVKNERPAERIIIEYGNETKWHLILIGLLLWNLLSYLYIVTAFAVRNTFFSLPVMDQLETVLLISFFFLPIICAFGAVLVVIRIIRSSKVHRKWYFLWMAVMAWELYLWHPHFQAIMGI